MKRGGVAAPEVVIGVVLPAAGGEWPRGGLRWAAWSLWGRRCGGWTVQMQRRDLIDVALRVEMVKA